MNYVTFYKNNETLPIAAKEIQNFKIHPYLIYEYSLSS